MNKITVYILLALILVLNVAAVGIGARNEKIISTGQKTVELFIINNEHKTFEVSIGVLGDLDGIEINPEQMTIESDQEIVPFKVSLDFTKIKNYTVKIFATETSRNSGSTLQAVANSVYKLPIVSQKKVAETPEQNATVKEEPKPNPANNTVKLNFKKNKDIAQPEKTEQPIANLAGAVAKEKPGFSLQIPEKDNAMLMFGGILVIVLIFSLSLVFTRKRTPLERYIIASKKIGKTEEEIKNSLKGAGWSDLIIESHIKK